jgi:glutamyl-tRNA synthetase
MSSTESIVVRIPPSPTGYFHVGRARTALFNFLFARKQDGKIVFRLEDTDRERSQDIYVNDILDSLAWLGISYDIGPFKQSERGAAYTSYIEKMIADGSAYVSMEEEGNNREVIRFKNPNKTIIFNDLIRGDISFNTTELEDFVIARNINDPLYHLTVVVDDFEMGVTHVIRGEDGISNTPRQILIQEAIGAPRPIYAHIPLILAADRSKMSARHGAVSLKEFREMGYLPEALINYLALLGWNPGTDQEIFSLDELIQTFDLERIQKGGAIFDREKLDWFNKEHMKLLSPETIQEEIKKAILASPRFQEKGWDLEEKLLSYSWSVFFDRINRWGEITTLLEEGEYDFFFERPSYNTSLLFWKEEKDSTLLIRHLNRARELIDTVSPDNFSLEAVKESVWDYATESGRGSVLWPIRVALSGKEKSPDPFTLASILGKKETLTRIDRAITLL